MKVTFTLRGKPVTLTTVDNVVAVRPTSDFRAALPGARLRSHFGGAVRDDSAGGPEGRVLPARNRKLFEQAGWMFVEAREPVTRAAESRTSMEGADAVRRVYVGRAGTMIATDKVTVQFPADASETQARKLLETDGLTLVRSLRLAPNTYEARLPTGPPELEVVQRLQDRRDTYLFAEPVLLEAIGGRAAPTDPGFAFQWQHANNGSNGGVAGADISSVAAWNLATGKGVRLAVIDNGMQVKHPDLKAGIVAGGHFVSNGGGTATFQRWQPGQAGFPGGDHGTFCLGMAGARWNNKKGGCGSAPECDLIAVACLPDQVGSQLTLARALAYSADPTTEDPAATAADGAHVIACSLGPNGAYWDMTSVLALAIQSAAANGRGGLGVPILWAATNGEHDIADDDVCSHPDVMAVSRSNRNDMHDSAGYGPKLEFLAPGVDVYSTSSPSKYGYGTGCSYAAPLAAGVAALVLERHPTWTAAQVRDRLRRSCDKIGGMAYTPSGPNGRNDRHGHGRVNAAAAAT